MKGPKPENDWDSDIFGSLWNLETSEFKLTPRAAGLEAPRPQRRPGKRLEFGPLLQPDPPAGCQYDVERLVEEDHVLGRLLEKRHENHLDPLDGDCICSDWYLFFLHFGDLWSMVSSKGHLRCMGILWV